MKSLFKGAARRPLGDSSISKLDKDNLIHGLRDLVPSKGFWIGAAAVLVVAILAANDALGGVVVVVVGVAAYFLPSFIAQKKPNANSVFVINLFFGWTLIGWVIALAMAVSEPKQPVVSLPVVPVAKRTGRSCPFCAEDIQPAAIVCKHCGRDLPSALPAQT
jgi:hypothetical protein